MSAKSTSRGLSSSTGSFNPRQIITVQKGDGHSASWSNRNVRADNQASRHVATSLASSSSSSSRQNEDDYDCIDDVMENNWYFADGDGFARSEFYASIATVYATSSTTSAAKRVIRDTTTVAGYRVALGDRCHGRRLVENHYAGMRDRPLNSGAERPERKHNGGGSRGSGRKDYWTRLICCGSRRDNEEYRAASRNLEPANAELVERRHRRDAKRDSSDCDNEQSDNGVSLCRDSWSIVANPSVCYWSAENLRSCRVTVSSPSRQGNQKLKTSKISTKTNHIRATSTHDKKYDDPNKTKSAVSNAAIGHLSERYQRILQLHFCGETFARTDKHTTLNDQYTSKRSGKQNKETMMRGSKQCTSSSDFSKQRSHDDVTTRRTSPEASSNEDVTEPKITRSKRDVGLLSAGGISTRQTNLNNGMLFTCRERNEAKLAMTEISEREKSSSARSVNAHAQTISETYSQNKTLSNRNLPRFVITEHDRSRDGIYAPCDSNCLSLGSSTSLEDSSGSSLSSHCVLNVAPDNVARKRATYVSNESHRPITPKPNCCRSVAGVLSMTVAKQTSNGVIRNGGSADRLTEITLSSLTSAVLNFVDESETGHGVDSGCRNRSRKGCSMRVANIDRHNFTKERRQMIKIGENAIDIERYKIRGKLVRPDAQKYIQDSHKRNDIDDNNNNDNQKYGDSEYPVVQQGQTHDASSNRRLLEWTVRRRSDGSRYVTKRPKRNALIRDRARQLDEGQNTTAAMSHWSDWTSKSVDGTVESEELTTTAERRRGNYWSCEERKKRRLQRMTAERMTSSVGVERCLSGRAARARRGENENVGRGLSNPMENTIFL